jgi:hypothetical protein
MMMKIGVTASDNDSMPDKKFFVNLQQKLISKI